MSSPATSEPTLASPPTTGRHSRPRAFLPVVLAIASVLVAMALGAIIGAGLPVTGPKEDPVVPWWVTILTILAYFIVLGGTGLALLWWTRRVNVERAPRLRAVVWLGIASGVLAVVVSWTLEDLTPHLGGWLGGEQGGNVLTGFIEEAAKLALPLILLAAPGLRRTLTGFWIALLSGATFTAIEGAMSFIGNVYEPNPPTPGIPGPVVEALNALNATGELQHIYLTGAAAAVIWFAATRHGARRAWLLGIGAFLVSAVAHAFNDGVLGYYLDGLPATLVAFAFNLVLLLAWFAPRVRRLTPPAITAESRV